MKDETATIEQYKKEFARYGFAAPPLRDSQMYRLARGGIDVNTVYSIGCDVAAGFTFAEAILADLETTITEETRC